MQQLEEIIYASRATRRLEQPELDELLRTARVRNAAAAITGVLLFHQGSFLQVIEGLGGDIQRLYVRIEADPRHGSMRLLRRRAIERRRFGEWAMGFVRKETAAKRLPRDEDLEGFADFLRTGRLDTWVEEETERDTAVLQAFRDGRYR